MKFEEQFPSLKGKVEIYTIGRNNGTSYFAQSGEWCDVMKKDLQEHCLDKQRVKEAIYAEGMNECVCGEEDCPACREGRMAKRILQRLGL